ncbi:MAG: excinuclease ABC subunit UvrC [candidate division KSB1 bacterium]|nr:excinuclease ABC subunit UvrC [candidate division KSB1 bacterium]MDZ7276197.1 excinuclease ABC subunit UvrC [candidate division KSB1 bacterium]MDZ7287023.1 excinuclease ABC subunit UvrC [candidate division KSB1 bacterium]MDZ7297052.1 excinuclease ABC subunit UvrC [candidate division KSB1 bacterium]MDZ7307187.1 excinuclease ABC subunit UvrC [candidate division KSB1 bacterium]
MSGTLQNKLDNLPLKPGVYQFKDRAGKIIYVGKAKVLRHRVRSYFQESRPLDVKTARLRSRIADLEIIVTDSEMEALILEMNLIKEYRPRYNVNLRDDKSFPYIRVTNELFPRIFPTRTLVKDGSQYFGPYTDVGQMKALLRTIKRIFPIRSCNYHFTPEVIAKKKYKLCLDYYIKKCDGPCEGLVSAAEYGQVVQQVVNFINGRDRLVVKEMQEKMLALAEKRLYEQAAKLRDRIRFIEEFQYRQKVVTADLTDRDIVAVALEDEDAAGAVFKVREGKIIGRQHYYLNGVFQEPYENVVAAFTKQYYLKADFIPEEIILPVEIPESEEVRAWLELQRQGPVRLVTPRLGEKAKLVEMCGKNAHLLLQELKLQKMKARLKLPHSVVALQRDLRLAQPPRRIECFDISNLQGTDPVAAMVTFEDGRPKKSDYRKFKIRGTQTPDDFAMMAEAIERRYAGTLAKKLPLPDLILVDGGKGQLNAALAVLQRLELNLPIAALAKRLDEVFVPGAAEAQNIPRTSSGLKLLQQLRDEAHRFGVTFHRSLRRKRTTASELSKIPGVGPARRKALLKFYGSLAGVRQASVDELLLVSGITPALAQRIWDYFHTESARQEMPADEE